MNETSPVPMPTKPATPMLMSFPEAMTMVILGNKVTRAEWDNAEEYGFINAEFLSIHTKGKTHQWLVSKADMEATDWFVLKHETKLNA